jgi:tetrahydromethanopterin S-methyltransferase subunit B
VAILFSFDRSECSSASVGLSTGAIVGIVIGIVALFAIIAIILVLRFKGVIRPFADHEKSKPTPVEEDPDL